MSQMWTLVFNATIQTLEMVLFSTIFSLLLGLPLGVILHVTGSEEHGGIKPMPLFNSIIGRIVNVLRSFPFIILMILLIPLSRLIVGTSIGTKLPLFRFQLRQLHLLRESLNLHLKRLIQE